MSTTSRIALGAALLALAGTAHAATFVASGHTHVLPGGPDDDQRDAGAAPVTISVQGQGALPSPSGGGISVGATGTASADMAGVHLTAQTWSLVDSTGPFDGGVAQVTLSASMGDRFTIASTTLATGESFTALVGFGIGGSLSGEARGIGVAESRSSWSGRMVARGPSGDLFDNSRSQDCFTSNAISTLNCFGDSFGTTWNLVSLTVGDTYSWSMQGDVKSSVNAVRASSTLSMVDLGHTLTWDGMRDLRDAQGNPISGISAISASTGFDYVKGFASAPSPVPEPGTWALMLAGLAGLASRARRRG